MNGSAIVGTVDTYVVEQTICGLVKTDTVTVTTVPLGMKEFKNDILFKIFPNPSDGRFTIRSMQDGSEIESLKVYDLLGRLLDNRKISLIDNITTIQLNLSQGNYFIELRGNNGAIGRERITIR